MQKEEYAQVIAILGMIGGVLFGLLSLFFYILLDKNTLILFFSILEFSLAVICEGIYLWSTNGS